MKKKNNHTSLSLRKKLALSIFTGFKNSEAKLHNLNYLFWECTLRCNLNCLHCGSDCTQKTDTPDMPLSDFVQVLKEIKSEYDPSKIIVAITGGEPLMRHDLAECGKAIKDLGYPWGMVTNGYLLNESKLDELIQAGLLSVTVSLDGLQESHDWLRNKSGSFDRAVNAIKAITKRPYLTYDVATCINKRNIGQLEDIYNLLLDCNVKYWRLFTIFPKGRAAENNLLLPDKELLLTLYEFIKSKRSENKIKVEYGCEGYLGDYEAEVRDGFFYCRAGISVGSVLIDGSISACPSLRSDFIQGNIYKDSFLDVWENKYDIMRDRKWTQTGICENCDSYKYCCGNGLHLRSETDKSLLFCHLNEME